jgi:hypothetical protein
MLITIINLSSTTCSSYKIIHLRKAIKFLSPPSWLRTRRTKSLPPCLLVLKFQDPNVVVIVFILFFNHQTTNSKDIYVVNEEFFNRTYNIYLPRWTCNQGFIFFFFSKGSQSNLSNLTNKEIKQTIWISTLCYGLHVVNT